MEEKKIQNNELGKNPVIGCPFDFDKFANALKNEFGESLVEERDGEDNPYNWWLTDVTVTDIVEFIKNYANIHYPNSPLPKPTNN